MLAQNDKAVFVGIKKKSQPCGLTLRRNEGAKPTLAHKKCTTMGMSWLNGQVRNGSGCVPTHYPHP